MHTTPVLLLAMSVLARPGGAECPDCGRAPHTRLERSRLDQLRLDIIQRDILYKLGLHDRPPNITESVPREVLFSTLERARTTQPPSGQQQSADDFEDGKARTSEIIAMARPGPKYNRSRLMEFYRGNETQLEELRVRSSYLWVEMTLRDDIRRGLRHMRRRRRQRSRVTIYVFRVLEKGERSAAAKHGRPQLVAKRRVRLEKVGWHRFNLKSAAQDWFDLSPDRPLRLLVDCVGCKSYVKSKFFQQGSDSSSVPFIKIRTQPVPARRVRRAALDCGESVTHCCRQRLYVSFRELRWDDWVLFPSGYYANYCLGNCQSRTPDTFRNFHTHVIEGYRQRAGELQDFNPCCAPTKLSPMSLLYFDADKNIIKRDLPKMVVEECGCM
ncbi:inhibin beta B chain-like [Amphibalanus amphitrite]|uniref:inhibin beta B chain-like n=1 Tax=Amphibalanus amphitrite TaxID=1232801 RepID=UPI001C91E0AF|nr:inhibin beta B chain-like [Amphibalanus amphitrite]